MESCREELAGEKKLLTEIASFFEASNESGLVERIRQSLAELRAESLTSRTNEELTNQKIVKVECDNKVSHEVVDRLVNDLNSSETRVLALKQELESLRIRLVCERDVALKGKSAAELELEKFKIGHANCEGDVEGVRAELEAARGKVAELAGELGAVGETLTREQNVSRIFREEVSRCLSDGQVSVEADERSIKESVQCLMASSTDRGIVRLVFFVWNYLQGYNS